MSNPYTAAHPHHASEYVQVKRAAKCKGCTQEDPTGVKPWIDGIIQKGERAVKCTIGSGPFTRTQHFHPGCYFTVRAEAVAQFSCPAWKVQPDKGQILIMGDSAREERAC